MFVKIILALVTITCIVTSENIGDPCESEFDCPSNSICGENNQCQCVETTFPSPDLTRCLLYATKVGDPCQIRQQCVTISNNPAAFQCDDETASCACSSGFIASTTFERCLPTRQNLTEECTDDKQCLTGNSFCVRESHSETATCKCGKDFVEIFSRDSSKLECFQIQREISGPCDYDEQCQAQFGPVSLCVPEVTPPFVGRCKCSSFNGAIHVPSDNRCYERVPLGRNCTSNYECLFGINQHAFCNPTSGKCECHTGALPSPYTDQWCYANRTIGSDCTEVFRDCSMFIEGTVGCDKTTNKCACQQEQVPTPDGRRCLRKPEKLSDACVYSAEFDYCTQLVENSHCYIATRDSMVGVCECRQGFFKNASADRNSYDCAPNPKKIGDFCSNSGMCLIISSLAYCKEYGAGLGRYKACGCMDISYVDEDGTRCILKSEECQFPNLTTTTTRRSSSSSKVDSLRDWFMLLIIASFVYEWK
ncbi:protein draper [Folsomia candida]|uniref:protein draper n=1 Tax=Folsomia candida TaxID=158441 RepID=UPI000B900AA7|nr:protein draper [Folsomia candida]